MKTKFLKFLIIFLTFIVVVAIAGFFIFTNMLSPVVADKTSENFSEFTAKIPRGAGLRVVGENLYENNMIKSPIAFYIYSRLTKPVVKAGIYKIDNTLSVKEILAVFESGKQAQIIVSVPEGLTMRRIGELLEEKDVVSKDEFLSACKSPELLKKYNLGQIKNFEGFLFPDTYYFTPSMKADDVVCIMVDNFFKKISQMEGFEDVTIERMYHLLRLASIVEREYRVKEEAPLIASVFANRLRRTIGLYSCATVEYIITEIEGRPHPDVITYKDLKIESPYNTYIHAGLPPTPISNPGEVALSAAATHPRTSYYFFRLVDPVKGTHYFSTYFDEHTEVGRNLSTKKAAGY